MRKASKEALDRVAVVVTIIQSFLRLEIIAAISQPMEQSRAEASYRPPLKKECDLEAEARAKEGGHAAQA